MYLTRFKTNNENSTINFECGNENRNSNNILLRKSNTSMCVKKKRINDRNSNMLQQLILLYTLKQ